MKKDILIPSDIENSVIPWIGKTAKMMSIHLKETFALKSINLTKEQFILLKELYKKDNVIQKDLAFITKRNKGSLARLINTMEKKKLVLRVSSEVDKRVNYIRLTNEGKNTYKTLQPVLSEEIKQMQQGLTEQEIEMTISVLKKIQSNIK